MIALTTNTPGIEFIRNEADWDTHDAYASLRSLQFDIAEAWYVEQEEALPGYRPGSFVMLEDWEQGSRAERLNGAMEHGIIKRDDIKYWWRVLDRMEALIIRAGRDY